MPNFIIVAFKMLVYSPQNRKKMIIFGINLPLRKNSGVDRKNEYRCTTTILPLCNDTIIVLKITLLHNISIIKNFVITKRDRHTNSKSICITSAGQCNIGRSLTDFEEIFSRWWIPIKKSVLLSKILTLWYRNLCLSSWKSWKFQNFKIFVKICP